MVLIKQWCFFFSIFLSCFKTQGKDFLIYFLNYSFSQVGMKILDEDFSFFL